LLVQLPDSVNINSFLLNAKSEGKRPLGKPRHRWEDDIKMDSQAMECGSMGWIELVQYRENWWPIVKAVLNLRVS
jgi:hypothetical protein